MKEIKKIFYFLMALILIGCIGILVCALQPDLTASLAAKVQEITGSSGNVGTDIPGSTDANTGGNVTGNGKVDAPGLRPDFVPDGNGRYEKPDKEPSNLPEPVSGKNGYQPVEDTSEQIQQEEADNLGDVLGTGELGETLSFSEEYYPYYAMLEENMKLLYKQIYANAQNLTATFAPVVTVDVNSLKNVFEAVCNDHPELFWLETGYSCKYLKNGNCVQISLKYNRTAQNLEATKEQVEVAVEEILAEARQLDGNLARETYVHNALIRLTEYDAQAEMNQSLYSALVNGKTVCAGYAKAFQYCMQKLGIPAYYCTGYAGQDHAWNIVKLGNDYFNVDVTWDDTEPATQDYFNKSDTEFADTHVRTGMSVYLPACNGKQETTTDAAPAASATPLPTPMVWHNNKNNQTPAPDSNQNGSGTTGQGTVTTMEDYYADCLKKLVDAGTGEIQFINVVPESLWSTIERAYSTGAYWDAYVTEALKQLGAENFAIQLQVQSIGGGYYRIYHNIYTE